MTKDKALYTFFAGFGLDTYTQTSVPDDVILPYLTYEPIFSAWDGGEVGITVNLWYYTDSEAVPNAKAQEISNHIGLGGVMVPCDEGAIWIKRGVPWCQNITDDTNPNIKRRYIQVTAEFLTLN